MYVFSRSGWALDGGASDEFGASVRVPDNSNNSVSNNDDGGMLSKKLKKSLLDLQK